MKKILAACMLSILVVIHACNVPSNQEKTTDTVDQNSLVPASAENALQESQNELQQIPHAELQIDHADSVTSKSGLKSIATADWDKKIIKTASLKIEVTDFKKYSEGMYKTVRQLGGYIAQEDQDLTPEKNESVISIKVPVYQFETMMNELPGNDTKVIERKINTDDVTGKIIDVKSRLEAKKEIRLKYLEFLKQSKNMKEVLQVQAEVNNIQEQIESAANQSNYLTHQSALSTVNLTFYQMVSGFKPEVVAAPSFLNRISDAFKTGGRWIADWIIGLIYIWPLVLIIVIFLSMRRKGMFRKITNTTSPSSNNK